MNRPITLALMMVVVAASAVSAQSRPASSGAKAAGAAAVAAAQVAADSAPKVLINRETFQYEADGRRDPFVSLLTTSDLRPLLSDLRLSAIAFDPRGRNSVAVLRDLTSKEQYKVRVGQTLGRMRVAAIQEKAVIFTIEEFGYSRQEMLSMSDSTKTRPPQ